METRSRQLEITAARLIFLLALLPAFGWAQTFTLQSPNGRIITTVDCRDTIHYHIAINGKVLLPKGALALITSQGSFGIRGKLRQHHMKSVDEVIINSIPLKRKQVPNHYNELSLRFRESFIVRFRAYDDGVAYRFEYTGNDSITIRDEIALLQTVADAEGYFPIAQKRDEADRFHSSFEEPYQKRQVTTLKKNELAFSPILLTTTAGHLLLTESDLLNYPGMFVEGTGTSAIKGTFAGYPLKETVMGGGFKQKIVTQRADYIAKIPGERSFPWRVLGIATSDKELLMNDIVFRLASPPLAGTDWSWVKPGITTEEWTAGENLRQVDFVAGINTATYKYYIDYAARFNIPYVKLDAGWSDQEDLFKVTPGLDLEEVAAYAKEKKIGLVLWTLAMTLDRQMNEVFPWFNRLGVKIVMTDFMDRDDQKMVEFYQRVTERAAAHQLMMVFHGAFKGAGFERTFPNNITREAALGSEYNIWSEKATPEHDVLLAFIRMASGAMDYQPGFYDNAAKGQFRSIFEKVMSQGTRTHQLAMFVVYESPLQMFTGNPSDALEEPAYTSFLTSIPTTWGDTRVLEAEVGKHLLIARQHGSDWYLGALNNWDARDYQINLDFLEAGHTYEITICQDGPNAHRNAKDYQLVTRPVVAGERLSIHLAPGGGYVARITRH